MRGTIVGREFGDRNRRFRQEQNDEQFKRISEQKAKIKEQKDRTEVIKSRVMQNPLIADRVKRLKSIKEAENG